MEAILQQILTELKTVNSRLDTLETGQANTAIQLDKVDTRLDTIEGKQGALSADIARLNHTIEPQLKAILEGIDGLQARNRQLDQLEDKVDDHDHRIWALEQTVKA